MFTGVYGARVWQLLQALDEFGLIDLTSGDHREIAVASLHPLVRDTSAPRAGPAKHDYPTFLTWRSGCITSRCVLAGQPEDPQTWPLWQLLIPHAMYIFSAVQSGLHWPDDLAVSAAYTATLAARYQAARGFYTQAEQVQRGVLPVIEKILGPDHPYSLAVRHEIARMMTQREDLAAAEAESWHVPAAELKS